MDALQIIIPAFTLILGLFIGYFLRQSEYERKRRDDKADKDADRLLERKNKKIAEAQECLNIFTETARMIMNVEMKALALKNADTVKTDTQKILQMMKIPTNTLMSMQFLNSSELAQAGSEFRTLIYDEYQKMMALLIALHNKKDIDEKAISDRISEFVNASGRYSGRIQVMLDKLASEIK